MYISRGNALDACQNQHHISLNMHKMTQFLTGGWGAPVAYSGCSGFILKYLVAGEIKTDMTTFSLTKLIHQILHWLGNGLLPNETKPLAEAMLTYSWYCQVDPSEHFSNILLATIFSSLKKMLNFAKWQPFCSGLPLMCLIKGLMHTIISPLLIHWRCDSSVLSPQINNIMSGELLLLFFCLLL